MQDGICGASHIKLAIAPGVPSRQLSALLALQREEAPEVAMSLSEVAGRAIRCRADACGYGGCIPAQPAAVARSDGDCSAAAASLA